MKIKMIDLWMQIKVRKLIFTMYFSVLDFFEFASRMLQTAQILVSTFKIFQGGGGGGMPPDPPRYFLFFFFSQAILRIWVLKFLFFSTLTQSGFLLVVADRLKSMLYLYQNIYNIYIFFTEVSQLTVAVRWLGTFANILFFEHQNDIVDAILRITK